MSARPSIVTSDRNDLHIAFESEPMVFHDGLRSTVIAIDQSPCILELFWHGLTLYGAV